MLRKKTTSGTDPSSTWHTGNRSQPSAATSQARTPSEGKKIVPAVRGPTPAHRPPGSGSAACPPPIMMSVQPQRARGPPSARVRLRSSCRHGAGVPEPPRAAADAPPRQRAERGGEARVCRSSQSARTGRKLPRVAVWGPRDVTRHTSPHRPLLPCLYISASPRHSTPAPRPQPSRPTRTTPARPASREGGEKGREKSRTEKLGETLRGGRDVKLKARLSREVG